MDGRAKVERFEAIRREYEFGIGTIQGVARRFGVHRRTVREAVETFTMLTTEPNDFTRHNPYTGGAQLHHLMPLILPAEHHEAWLDPHFGGAKALIVPYSDVENMRAEAVAVQSSRTASRPATGTA